MRQNPHRPAASPPSVKKSCLRLCSAGKNAEAFRWYSQKCTIPGKRDLPAGGRFLFKYLIHNRSALQTSGYPAAPG